MTTQPAGELPLVAGSDIDPHVLAEAVGHDPLLLCRVLRGFLQAGARNAQEACAAVARRDLPSLGAAAHRMRSSARSAGARALSDLCASIDAAVRRHDDAVALQLGGEFEANWLKARDCLRAQLRSVANAVPARVLLIDDDPFQRDLLRTMLHGQGGRVPGSGVSLQPRGQPRRA